MAIIYNANDIAGKICRVCGQWKPLAEYSPRKEHSIPTGDGYQNACKSCRSAAEMERYRAKGEAGKAQLRKQYAAHREARREQINARIRAYRASHPDKVRAKNQSYYHRFPEKFLEIVNRRRAR